jgi:hypothetical protein
MTAYPGSETQPPAQQPPVQPEKSNTKKWLAIAGTVAVVGIGGAYTLTGGFGIGAPKVDDCIQTVGETDFEVVDCDSSDADYKIIGIMDEKQTEDEFMADTETCSEWADATEYAYWESTGFISAKGSVYCAGAL